MANDFETQSEPLSEACIEGHEKHQLCSLCPCKCHGAPVSMEVLAEELYELGQQRISKEAVVDEIKNRVWSHSTAVARAALSKARAAQAVRSKAQPRKKLHGYDPLSADENRG